MSLFGNLKSDGLEESQDRLGGYSPLDTDIYTGTIKALYAGKSGGGAMSVNLVVDVGGKEYRETLWVTNKRGENWFPNKQDKTKKVPLPGFTIADDICLIATGKPLSDQVPEERVVKIYNYDSKKEENTGVDMIVDAIGQKISLGILRQLENKNEKQGDEYVATAETKETNVIDKVFHPEEKMTVAEARGGATEAKFWDSWLERNKGQTRDKRTVKEGQAGGARTPAPKAGAAGGDAAAAPRKSLFGNK